MPSTSMMNSNGMGGFLIIQRHFISVQTNLGAKTIMYRLSWLRMSIEHRLLWWRIYLSRSFLQTMKQQEGQSTKGCHWGKSSRERGCFRICRPSKFPRSWKGTADRPLKVKVCAQRKTASHHPRWQTLAGRLNRWPATYRPHPLKQREVSCSSRRERSRLYNGREVSSLREH